MRAAPKTADAEAHAEHVRAEILRHATDLFEHYGFSKTNVGDIAERVGMSPGNLYRYFRNKQDIGRAVVTEFFRCSQTAMETGLLLPGGTAEERLRLLMLTGVSHLVDEMRTNPRLVELAEFICSDPEGTAILEAHIAWRQARMADEIARGIAAGELRAGEPEALARALHNATKVFWVPMALARMPADADVPALLSEVLDLVFSGLRARG